MRSGIDIEPDPEKIFRIRPIGFRPYCDRNEPLPIFQGESNLIQPNGIERALSCRLPTMGGGARDSDEPGRRQSCQIVQSRVSPSSFHWSAASSRPPSSRSKSNPIQPFPTIPAKRTGTPVERTPRTGGGRRRNQPKLPKSGVWRSPATRVNPT